MNKQEALEALLVQLREWEEPTAEVPARTLQWVARQMREAVEAVGEGDPEWDARQYTIIGAAALYFLRDEVEVVEPRSLDSWLAEGMGIMGPLRGGPADPKPINGVIGRRLG